MLRPRIIPCLLIQNGGLVKTVQFKDPIYIGDPLNAVRIFNEKEVDELIVLDIDASSANYEPNYSLIASMAAECQMPLCYGGGIKTSEQVERIVGLGVEKVAISSAAVATPELITLASRRVGKQSIVVVLDVKRSSSLDGGYKVFTHNGKVETNLCPIKFSSEIESLGAGELLINSIARDGLMIGYDIPLVDRIHGSIGIPLSIMGGAGSFADLSYLIQRYGLMGCAAGSIFVLKGKYRAVLIQYPDRETKEKICMVSGLN